MTGRAYDEPSTWVRATIEEIAAAKGITYVEAVRRIAADLERVLGPLDPPPTPAAPARHLPIDDSGDGCVAWCPACRDQRYAHEAASR